MFRIDKQKAVEVLGSKGITAEWLSEQMSIPESDMIHMLLGNLELDMEDTQKLMSLIGYFDLARICADGRVYEIAELIANKNLA